MSTPQDVELERDHYWWLHPGLRGRQALPGDAGNLPWRWSTRAAQDHNDGPRAVAASGPYADFAKLLYKMNGYRPGPVRGWYVVVEADAGRFAVGQLCVDPHIPVVLFEDHVYSSEAAARSAAAALKADNPGLQHST